MNIKEAVLDKDVIIYPYQTISIETCIVGEGQDHPVSISVFNEAGLLKVKIKNEHPARLLKLPKGFHIAGLLIGE